MIEQQQQEKKESVSQIFQRQIVQPLLGQCYIDLATTVHLPTAMASRLYYSAITSGLIPSSRLPDWKVVSGSSSSSISSGDDDGMVMASLLRDYKQLPPRHHLYKKCSDDEDDRATSNNNNDNNNNITTISIEIKPKAGYITTSPLVHPKNRCKYKHTRYALQQQLMHCGHVTKGWQQQQQEGANSTAATAASSSLSSTTTTTTTTTTTKKAVPIHH
jgi:hypothetical protein